MAAIGQSDNPHEKYLHVGGWSPTPKDDPDATMQRNFEKAVGEGQGADVATYEEVQASLKDPEEPLSYSTERYADIGIRSSMEDTDLVFETEEYLLAAVFDGHGGALTSQLARAHFLSYFCAQADDVRFALEDAIHNLEKKIIEAACKGGSTALITYIDKLTHKIYTATVGDSTASIYRRLNDNTKAIPLSCVRKWTSVSDLARASKWADYSYDHDSMLRLAPQYQRLGTGTLNVSRALGDQPDKMLQHDVSAITHKPKVTVTQLMPGDVVILSCDGLTDYVKVPGIIDVIETTETDLPARLGAKAIANMREQGEGDNITVIAIHVLLSA